MDEIFNIVNNNSSLNIVYIMMIQINEIKSIKLRYFYSVIKKCDLIYRKN